MAKSSRDGKKEPKAIRYPKKSQAKKGRPQRRTKKNETRFSRMKDATILKAIEGSNGIVSNVAEALGGCDWHTAKKLIERNERTKAAWEAENERMLDFAEEKLHGFLELDPVSLRYYLDRKARSRGYGEAVSLDHTTKGEKLPENTTKQITVLHLPPHLRPDPAEGEQTASIG